MQRTPANCAVNFCHVLSVYFVTAHNGAEGLDTWRLHAPDIVITDVQMPVMDGLSMAAEIRSRDMSVPIIVLTAFDRGVYLFKSINNLRNHLPLSTSDRSSCATPWTHNSVPKICCF